MAAILGNDENFNELLESNEKLIVKFYADWCGVCKKIKPRYNRLSEDEKYTGVKFVEMKADLNPKTRLAAGVYSLPFFATYNEGEMKGKVTSGDERQVVGLLDELVA
ncbi:MAG: thioredoxin family protein [Bacteroidota bacterium]